MVFGPPAAPQTTKNSYFRWKYGFLVVRAVKKPSKISKKLPGTKFFLILAVRNVMKPTCAQGRCFPGFLAGRIILLKSGKLNFAKFRRMFSFGRYRPPAASRDPRIPGFSKIVPPLGGCNFATTEPISMSRPGNESYGPNSFISGVCGSVALD